MVRVASVSTVAAGLIAVLVGLTSSAAIVFAAARAVGAGEAELASWMLALGMGMGVTSIGLSLRYRAPVVTAWSTPGADLLAVGLDGISMAQAATPTVAACSSWPAPPAKPSGPGCMRSWPDVNRNTMPR
jgi:predicted benzoate:H+ symporter BenE